MRDLLVTVSVLLVLGGALVIVPRFGRHIWGAEMQRKGIHVIMGLVCLPFPWLFDHALPVVLLATFAMIGLAVVRLDSRMRAMVGSSLHGVGRQSMGEIYFPLAVGALFYLAHEDPLLYMIPLLLLTFGDTAGALVGSHFGRRKFKVPGGEKSLEGFLATFAVGFLVVILALAIDGRAAVPEMILISLILAAVAAMMEATSGAGLDNLVLPLAGYALLERYLGLPWHGLLGRLVVIYGLLSLLYVFRHLTSLNGGGILGAILFCYGAYALGGPGWLVAPLLVYACHIVSLIRHQELRGAMHDASIVMTLCGGALIWLVIGIEDVLPLSMAAMGYSAGIGAHATMIRLRHRRSCTHPKPGLIESALEGALVLTLSYGAIAGWHWMILILCLGGTGVLWGCGKLFLLWDSRLGDPDSVRSWMAQAFLSFAFSSATMLIAV